MKKKALALALGGLLASAAVPAYADFTLSILHINDVHSRICASERHLCAKC